MPDINIRRTKKFYTVWFDWDIPVMNLEKNFKEVWEILMHQVEKLEIKAKKDIAINATVINCYNT